MEIDLGFSTGSQRLSVPSFLRTDVLKAKPAAGGTDEQAEILRALENPIGTPRLRDIVKPGEKIAVISSDITRPMPTAKVMPAVLDELYSAGVSKEDIVLVLALGSHRKHTEEEMRRLAGERAFSEIEVTDSDPADCVHMGETSNGTPVDITRKVALADRRICLGNVEFHWFAGFSGGAKAIMPGVSTREAIQKNHSLMVRDGAHSGNLESNPLRMDLEEAVVRFCPADFMLNVVLDEHKNIVRAEAGDIIKAHREACGVLSRMYRTEMEDRADIVVVSQGGAPKDLNLYQLQKALDNAKHAVKAGGTIILVGSCREGFGEKVFEDWMLNSESPEAITARIEKNFTLGGHKAAGIAMVMKYANIFLVSEMEPETVKRAFMTPFSDVQEAFDKAAAEYGKDARVIIMPHGGSTLPFVRS